MTKIYKPILIEDYGFVVDENSNNNATKGLNYNFGTKRFENLDYDYDKFTSEWKFCKKVIGSIGKRLDGVPLIELLSKAEQLFPKLDVTTEEDTINIYKREGYEANINKYSEEDMRNAVKLGLSLSTMTDEPFTSKKFKTLESITVEAYLQSLQKQPIPTEVELEIQIKSHNTSGQLISKEFPIIHNKETDTITAVNYN